MTTKTKILFIVIVLAAGIVVGGILLSENLLGYTLPTRGGINVAIKVAVAPALEKWAQAAAAEYNSRNQQISVQTISLKGLDAPQQLDLSKDSTLPDAWIAEADFIRQMAGAVPYDQIGSPIAHTGLTWMLVAGRDKLTGIPDWPAVYEAAVNNPQFRAAIPSPANSVEGLAAYLSAAAAYHNQPVLNQTLVGDPGFIDWIAQILIAVPEQRLAPISQLTRTPPSVDVGLVLESEVSQLNTAQFVKQSPVYNILFNFPYLIRRGSSQPNAADREKAATQFKEFLLSADQQNRLAQYGLQPGNTPPAGQFVTVDGATANRLHSQYR